MRVLRTVLFLTSLLGLSIARGQVKGQFISIDHIPIVVQDLNSVKRQLSESFHFKIKEGREHEGIINCFIKFQDGTYLEFVTPVDSSQKTGKYYTDFLRNRQGGTALAVSVESADSVIKALNKNAVPFETSSNRIWTIISPRATDHFFIDYADKQWKDSEVNTTHLNQSLSLRSTYVLSDDIELEMKKYKDLGFNGFTNGSYLGAPGKILEIGNSKLYLLDASKSKRITKALETRNLTGICGFEIKTSSLNELNRQLFKSEKMIIEKNRTILYLKDLNFFFVFTE